MYLKIIKNFSLSFLGLLLSVSASADIIPFDKDYNFPDAYGSTKIECDISTDSIAVSPEKIYILASCNNTCSNVQGSSAIPATINSANIGDLSKGVNASIKGSNVINKLVIFFKFLPKTNPIVQLSFRKYSTAVINVNNCKSSPELGRTK